MHQIIPFFHPMPTACTVVAFVVVVWLTFEWPAGRQFVEFFALQLATVTNCLPFRRMMTDGLAAAFAGWLHARLPNGMMQHPAAALSRLCLMAGGCPWQCHERVQCRQLHRILQCSLSYTSFWLPLREESGLAGSVVVQDALHFLNQLLRGNAANQRLFREMGHLGALAGLISAAAQAGPGGEAAGREMAPGLLLALESVLLMVRARYSCVKERAAQCWAQ